MLASDGTLSDTPTQGGVFSFQVTAISGPCSLLPGLNLNVATGSLSGTPSTNGTSTFTITGTAVFRRSTGEWLIKRGSDSQTIIAKWSLATDVPVPGDYDGDGKTGIAIWRGSEGRWYIVESGNAETRTVSWGVASPGDVPVPGDDDGDGKADVAVWRESSGTWYVKRSSDGAEVMKAHGQSGDVPVAARRN